MIVDFPDPDDPTSAVTVPGCATNDTSCKTVFEGSYANVTSSKITSPRISLSVTDRRGSSSSGTSPSTSRVRSSPAIASVSCVPTLAIWKIGAAR